MIVAVGRQLFSDAAGGHPVERDETGRLTPVSDVVIPAAKYLAVIALSKLVDDPSAPRIDLKKITYKEEDVEAWRNGWTANSESFLSTDSAADP